MNDFVLDLRSRPERMALDAARPLLQYYPDIAVACHDRDDFRLIASSCDDAAVWSPYECPRTGVLVAVCGRVAFDRPAWSAAARAPGAGGLASKAVFQLYERDGIEGLRALNGNFTVLVHEPARRSLSLVTDRTGTCLPFGPAEPGRGLVFSSHPDVAAAALGVADRWDEVSLAELLLTGRLAYPRTLYAGVRALEFGSILRLEFSDEDSPRITRTVHSPLEIRLTDRDSEAQLAEELAEAFRMATERRTIPELGRVAVALSGGLDSRVILSSVHEDADVVAFCCSDRENAELRAARAIAGALGVEFVALARSFDHYGDTAGQGVRISGGMGDIGSNHFLGFRDEILEMGSGSLITGCYCDYLFKSLAIDTELRRLSRREVPAAFRRQTYLPYFDSTTELADAVRGRAEEAIPAALRSDTSEAARLEVAKLRTFPLEYEADNVQRTTVQRCMRWFPPAVDNDVIDVYLKTPLASRLNKSLFTKMVLRRCSDAVCRIHDTNTGTRVGGPAALVSLNRYRIALRRARERRRRAIASEESWPNWTYYLQNSPRIDALWRQPNPIASELFEAALGSTAPKAVSDCFAEHGGFRGSVLALRMLTVKLWTAQRFKPVGDRADSDPGKLPSGRGPTGDEETT